MSIVSLALSYRLSSNTKLSYYSRLDESSPNPGRISRLGGRQSESSHAYGLLAHGLQYAFIYHQLKLTGYGANH
jgi:hypothetical protein